MARNQTASVGTAVLSDTLTVLVQTNYDRWQPDPKFDPRRTRAEEMLQSVLLGSGTGHDAAATALDLLAVASAYPVHNPHTAVTADGSSDRRAARVCAGRALPNKRRVAAHCRRSALLPKEDGVRAVHRRRRLRTSELFSP